MRDLKSSTSKFISYNRSLFSYFEGFGREYFAETHCMLQKDTIRNYIKGQKQHHIKIGFKEEMQQLYIGCGQPFNEYSLADI